MFSRAAKNRQAHSTATGVWHPTRGPRWPVIAAGAFCFLLASSCGGPKIPEIKGRLPVFHAKGSLQTDDGKPLSEAKLVFHPVHELPADASKFLPRARTKDDGTFTVSTYADDDGAPPGEYWVTVSWRGNEPNLRNEEEAEQVPMEYRNRSTKLRCKIEEGENTIPPFEIKMPQQQASNETN